jgi:hypothetical protein
VYGLLSLKEQVEHLNDYSLDDLYLVTTAHRHSWVQYYMPGYGWVDFETTAYAIPPMGSGDPNSMDVVIPILENQEQLVQRFVIPWGLILRSALIVTAVVLVALYSLRYGTEAYLGHLVNTKKDKALPAMYQLLLMKLATCGYEIKRPSETPLEYSEQHPELGSFAQLYTTLRFRENISELDRTMLYSELQARFVQTLMKARRPGLKRAIARVFSLKGLYYR